jgi:hypothetical protein
MENDKHISPEQKLYATLLSWGGRAGLLILVISFLAYTVGLVPAHVALDKLHEVWTLPLAQYLAQTQTPAGWHWLGLVANGDFASLIGIAILCGVSLVCLLAVIPIYARRGDWIYVTLCVAALAIQLLAASGKLGVGH